MAEDRTEHPTARRLRDARKKGQIARSRDVEQAAQLGAVLIALVWFGGVMVQMLRAELRQGLERVGTAGVPIEPTALAGLAAHGTVLLAMTVGPLAAAAIVATLASAYAQGGWNLAPEALKPNWGRLSPVNGLKRLGFQRVGFDLLKMLVLVVALVWIATRIVVETVGGATYFGRADAYSSALIGWDFAERLLKQALVVLAVVAGGDYALQRWRLVKSLRMTKQEVRDDVKLTEGNPEIKARLRRVGRELARRRMLSSVPKATVVITNPTEYAVALQYERGTMPAPRVVAKGRNLLAARIRAIAREHSVPIVENVPLAQALYRGTEVGDTIPADLFGAVAEVLAYLIRLRQVTV